MEKGIWKKGSRSNGSGGNNCVEVLAEVNNTVYVRHSQDRGQLPLVFTAAEWSAFVESAKLGEFDL